MSESDPLATLAEGITRLRNVCDPSDVNLRNVISCSIDMVKAIVPHRVVEFQRIVDEAA